MQENDEFQKRVLLKIEELKECQSKNSLSSCFECKRLFECELRISYVKSVYESMNQGKSLDFDF